jgi:2-succinyl-5-enolpyruvyl-6-hydroxy-3-cyclohexene-1-carboxylate synthase
VHSLLDERCAGFFALGIGRASGRPAAVLTTSGTAAANLLPATIEASLGESPLLLVTADRPAHLRGLDANQTIDQVRLFGPYVRLFCDIPLVRTEDRPLRHLRAVAARAVAASRDAPRGPVHLNVQFEEPLEPTPVEGDVPASLLESAGTAVWGRVDGAPYTRLHQAPSASDELAALVSDRLSEAQRGLIVCGPTHGPEVGEAVLQLGAASGVPVLADPLSGARFAAGATAHAIAAYDLFLAHARTCEALTPDLVLRIGSAPTSAATARFLDACGSAEQVVVDAGGRWKDYLARAHDYVRADAASICRAAAERVKHAASPEWMARWRGAERLALGVIETALGGELFEGAAAASIAETLPDGSTWFVGNSMPIRDVDAFAIPREAALHMVGHRGASGIDGNVSSALGVSAVSAGPTLALLGDLTFLHDQNGLMAARRERLPIVFVIIQNDGGGIFHQLPIRGYDPPFTEHIVMPHGLDLARVARVYELPHRRVGSTEELRTAVQDGLASGGPSIVEVPIEQRRNWEIRNRVAREVRSAMESRR